MTYAQAWIQSHFKETFIQAIGAKYYTIPLLKSLVKKEKR